MTYCLTNVEESLRKKKPYREKKQQQIHNPGQEEKGNEDKRNTKIIWFSRKILVTFTWP